MMKTSFELIAEFREDQGKGASRRLRHAGRVPAILYGGARDPRALSLDHNKVAMALDNERFYSTIITLQVGEVTQQAILRDVQRHPWKNQIVHVDFQRVFEDATIRLPVPLHFTGEAASPGVKTEGGMMSHLKNEVIVECLRRISPSSSRWIRRHCTSISRCTCRTSRSQKASLLSIRCWVATQSSSRCTRSVLKKRPRLPMRPMARRTVRLTPRSLLRSRPLRSKSLQGCRLARALRRAGEGCGAVL